MSTKLEGDKYITLHLVWPAYLQIANLLCEEYDNNEEASSLVSDMKAIGREYVEKNAKDMEPTFEHKAMTFLTPTMKKLNFIDYRSRYKLHTDIEKYIQKYEVPDLNENNENNEKNENEVCILPTLSNLERGLFENFFSFDDTSDDMPDSEVELYFKHSINQNVDTTSWWCDNAEKYPKLFKLFKELCCIPATSASSERDFSVAGNIVNNKRSVILPANVNNIIVARNFM